MAKKSAEHKKLTKEAKGLGIASPHLFGIDKLKQRIEEAKRVKPDEGGSAETATPEKPLADQPEENAITKSISGLSEKKAETDKDQPAPQKLGGPSDVTVKDGDSFLYHETEQPRLFVDGEEVPEGWNIENHKCWKVSGAGKYINVNG